MSRLSTAFFSFALALVYALSMVGSAPAAALPPGMPQVGKVMLGVGGSDALPGRYTRLTGTRHNLALRSYSWRSDRVWSQVLAPDLQAARQGRYRLMLHLTPRDERGREAVTPRTVANGGADAYLLRLGAAINASGQYVYVRPPGEMNAHWSEWCAFDRDGSRRDAAHATREYRRAFQRIALIVRGGNVGIINAGLRLRGLPALRTGATRLPRSGRIALIWNPQGRGAPDVNGNQPTDYYPGATVVDYVANDLYAQEFRAAWADNDALYARYAPRHPYMIAEYAPWGTDDPAFMRRMFAWVATHRRTVALAYFHGTDASPFRLDRKPRSLAIYRVAATDRRFSCPRLGPLTVRC